MSTKIAYHLDLANSLPLGTLSLDTNFCAGDPNIDSYIHQEFPDGISRMGKIYLSYVQDNNHDNVVANAVEYIFESVRQQHFPHLPSRMKSLFAVENAAGIQFWFEELIPNCSNRIEQARNATVKTIRYDSDNAFKADAKYRDYRIVLKNKTKVFSSSLSHKMAFKYWSGSLEQDPKLELVIPLPVEVINSTPLNTFLANYGLQVYL